MLLMLVHDDANVIHGTKNVFQGTLFVEFWFADILGPMEMICNSVEPFSSDIEWTTICFFLRE